MTDYRIERLTDSGWSPFMIAIPSAPDGKAHLSNLAANERSSPTPTALRLVDADGAEVAVWHPGMVAPAEPARDVKPVGPPVPAKKKRAPRKKGAA